MQSQVDVMSEQVTFKCNSRYFSFISFLLLFMWSDFVVIVKGITHWIHLRILFTKPRLLHPSDNFEFSSSSNWHQLPGTHFIVAFHPFSFPRSTHISAVLSLNAAAALYKSEIENFVNFFPLLKNSQVRRASLLLSSITPKKKKATKRLDSDEGIGKKSINGWWWEGEYVENSAPLLDYSISTKQKQ